MSQGTAAVLTHPVPRMYWYKCTLIIRSKAQWTRMVQAFRMPFWVMHTHTRTGQRAVTRSVFARNVHTRCCTALHCLAYPPISPCHPSQCTDRCCFRNPTPNTTTHNHPVPIGHPDRTDLSQHASTPHFTCSNMCAHQFRNIWWRDFSKSIHRTLKNSYCKYALSKVRHPCTQQITGGARYRNM